jgi:hypothetical protein
VSRNPTNCAANSAIPLGSPYVSPGDQFDLNHRSHMAVLDAVVGVSQAIARRPKPHGGGSHLTRRAVTATGTCISEVVTMRFALLPVSVIAAVVAERWQLMLPI